MMNSKTTNNKTTPADDYTLDDIPGWDTYLQPILTSQVRWWRNYSTFEELLMRITMKMIEDKRTPEYIARVRSEARKYVQEERIKSGDPLRLQG